MNLYTEQEIKSECHSLYAILRRNQEEAIKALYGHLYKINGMSRIEINKFYSELIFRTIIEIMRCGPKDHVSLEHLSFTLQRCKWETIRLVAMYDLQDDIIRTYNRLSDSKVFEKAMEINDLNEVSYYKRKKISGLMIPMGVVVLLGGLINAALVVPIPILSISSLMVIIFMCKMLLSIEKAYKPREFSPNMLKSNITKNLPDLIWNKNERSIHEEQTIVLMTVTLLISFGNLIRFFL
jgi:hypothetical protein